MGAGIEILHWVFSITNKFWLFINTVAFEIYVLLTIVNELQILVLNFTFELVCFLISD